MFQVTIRQTGFETVYAKLNRLMFAGNDISGAWPEVVGGLKAIETLQFETEGSAGENPPWPALSTNYAKWKARRYPGTKIMERTGRLKNSLVLGTGDTIDLRGPRRLTFGTRVPYAGWHQVPGLLPKWRPTLSLTNRHVAEITAAIRRYISAEILGGTGQRRASVRRGLTGA